MLTRTSSTLLEGLKDSGDKAAWMEFDRRYRPLVLAVARRLGLQEADAEDAAQETMTAFVQAYRSKRYEKERGRLRDWLRGMAVHKIRDIYRKRRKQARCISDQGEESILLSQIEDRKVEDLWEDEWKKAVLRQCLEEVRREVSPKSFEAFRLFALEQWPAKKVADLLEVSEDVVYQSKSRILARVRKMLPTMKDIW